MLARQIVSAFAVFRCFRFLTKSMVLAGCVGETMLRVNAGAVKVIGPGAWRGLGQRMGLKPCKPQGPAPVWSAG